nr:DUF1127 domain-containing protein [uncultured Celeribacter sp.]
MAHIAHPTARTSGFSLSRMIRTAVEGIRLSYARQRAYSTTFNQLDALSDHELSDIGLGRSDIIDIARAAARAV